MADGADAITNGFQKVFGHEFNRLMCFFHVMKNLDTHLRPMPKNIKTAVRRDIELMQLCPSKVVFEKSAKLFLEKWANDSELQPFLQYFKTQWLIHLPNWYEGASPGNPSTNNSLEATNGTIKKEHTIRERLPLAQFLNVAVAKILPSWSTERDISNLNCKRFAEVPSKTLNLWTKAYQWAISDVTVLSDGKLAYYYVVRSFGTTICNQLND